MGLGIFHRRLDAGAHADARVRPITDINQPSPFTRVGPGVGASRKPDLVDLGGTAILDTVVQRLYSGRERPAAGILTTHADYQTALVASVSGTSFAAPRVAFRAAQLLRMFPTASANLLRALLMNAADIPTEAREKLAPLGANAAAIVCGAGVADHERAAYSDNARVVFYAEDDLAVDHFAVYRLPIPAEYQETRGRRHIRVTLAYDPPVKETRNDYRGITMAYELIRGKTAEEVFRAFRKSPPDGADSTRFLPKYSVTLEPKVTERNRSTVQRGQAIFQNNLSTYGDEYFLVVTCRGGWAEAHERQNFAVVVEIGHSADIRLYERLQQRVQVRA